MPRMKVLELEWHDAWPDINGLHGYNAVYVLVRSSGRPVAQVTLPLHDGACAASALRAAVPAQRGEEPTSAGTHAAQAGGAAQPLVTVAVCTRDRAADLRRCLESLTRLDYPALDLLVIDNAPESDATERVVREFERVRYVTEPRPGLNWARNRAIMEARGEIIGYIDDDALADPGWASAVAAAFSSDGDVAAVTGLVVPQELETDAQLYFEEYGGFSCGFQSRRFCWSGSAATSWRGEIMECGTGANMAFRRLLFDRVGHFDTALDAGTLTGGGGDVEMFFRVLKEGGVLVYEPAALVYHVHRRDLDGLHKQIESWGTGVVAVLARSAAAYPEERGRLLHLGVHGVLRQVRRLLTSIAKPPRFPRRLLLAELRGVAVGLGRYRRARETAKGIEQTFGPAGGTGS
jgi:O-antigen biosynthesis protein